jgi:hypothetical protein
MAVLKSPTIGQRMALAKGAAQAPPKPTPPKAAPPVAPRPPMATAPPVRGTSGPIARPATSSVSLSREQQRAAIMQAFDQASLEQAAELAAANALPIAVDNPPRRGPGRPSNAELAARQAAVAQAQHRTPAPLTPRDSPMTNASAAHASHTDLAQLRRTIGEQTETIKAMSEQIAALKAKPSNVRSLNSLVEGSIAGIDLFAGIAEDDTRRAWHGIVIPCYQHSIDNKGNVTLDEQAPPADALVVIPQDNDPGGQGSRARSMKQLALYFIQRQDGSWEGPPSYLYEYELNDVRAD